MATKRLHMHKTKEILRLKWGRGLDQLLNTNEGPSRALACSCTVQRGADVAGGVTGG